jgi:N-ethylmaleimide reductase
VTNAAHARGASMVLQIMHCGRIAHPLNRQIDDLPVAPSAVRPAGQMWTDQLQMQDMGTPRALELSEIPGVIDEFVHCARAAREAGFDGVEIHAANGYLHNQFLACNSNVRTDAYGGSVNGRIRFTVETTRAVAAAIGADRTGIRISPGHMFNDIQDTDPVGTNVALLDALDTERLAYVHVMLPDAFAAALNNAGDVDNVLKTMRAHAKGALIAAGGYTREKGQAALDAGTLQAVAFGRPFIANPDLVQRLRNDAPLAQPNEAQFYTPGPEGYSDYPAAT